MKLPLLVGFELLTFRAFRSTTRANATTVAFEVATTVITWRLEVSGVLRVGRVKLDVHSQLLSHAAALQQPRLKTADHLKIENRIKISQVEDFESNSWCGRVTRWRKKMLREKRLLIASAKKLWFIFVTWLIISRCSPLTFVLFYAVLSLNRPTISAQAPQLTFSTKKFLVRTKLVCHSRLIANHFKGRLGEIQIAIKSRKRQRQRWRRKSSSPLWFFLGRGFLWLGWRSSPASSACWWPWRKSGTPRADSGSRACERLPCRGRAENKAES